jgi:hypothetical protein
LRAGGHGITVANKATCIYANYLEGKEKIRFDLFVQAARQAEAQQAADPKNANAWFWHAARASAWPRRWGKAWAARSNSA